MGQVKIPYYHVNEFGKGHWKPGKKARELGFGNVSCGTDGPAAWAKARDMNRRLAAARLNGPEAAQKKLTWWQEDDKIIYPPGSIGTGFQQYRKIKSIWIDGKSEATREEWGRGWKHFKPYAECAANTMTLEILADLRSQLLEEKGPDAAWRTIKFWRALWNALVSVRHASGEDPSKQITNSAPKGRKTTWTYGQAVRMVKHTWRQGHHAHAVLQAICWDTQLSPADVRKLTLKQRKRDNAGTWFETSRSKTRESAIATLSRKTERLLEAYLAMMPALPITEPFLRNRSGQAFTKNKASEDFRDMRRELGFPDHLQLRDFRRTGAVEAIVGGASTESTSMKMANTLTSSKSLQKTYVPAQVEIIRDADRARVAGRAKLRDKK
ncbi:MAG: hypothetical protein AAGF33_14270 [Pseudomonadota bacterium]